MLGWLAVRMPAWVSPDKLTAVGVAGAFLALAGYAITPHATAGLWLASLGYAVNWFGDSLDGTLARHRKIERPRYGYFLDNAIDVAQQFVIAIGIGLSGLVRWDLSFLALAAFFMMSLLTLLRAQVSSVFHLTYGGVGPTELRVFAIVLNAVVYFWPPERWDGLGLPMTYPNLISMAWSLSMLVTFVLGMAATLRKLAAEEPPRS